MKTTILNNQIGIVLLFYRLLLIQAFFITPFFLNGQCIATSTVSGSSASNDNAVGTIDFLNTSNVFASDDSRADATAVVNLFTGSSKYLKVTGFGFAIPSYCTICGVVVEIEKRAGGISIGAWVRDNQVKLVKANTVTGNSLGNTLTDWPTTDANTTYGGASNLWGTTLTPADVNATNFGVAIAANFNGLIGVFPSAQIDHIRMTIYYDPILPLHLISFTSSLKKNIAYFKWRTADEEVNDAVTLQRSITGSLQWTDIIRYETQSDNNGKEYSYNDPLTTKGNYSYRLKITTSVLQTTYSEIRNVRYTGNPFINIYPNPAGNFIIIENANAANNIIISNMFQQKLKSQVQINGSNSIKIDISQFPPGGYFVAVDNQKLKFIKE